MAIAADSRDRVAEPQPAEDAWTVGALLGAALGISAVALVFAPPVAVLVVLALSCGAISLASGSHGLPVASFTGAVPRIRHAMTPMVRAVMQWARGLSLPEQREQAPDLLPTPTEPIAAPAANPPPVVEAAPVEQATVEMPAIVPPPVAEVHGAPAAVTPAAQSRPSTEELVVEARQLESAGDLAGAENALARAAADGHRLAAMHLGELQQRNGDAFAAVDAYRQAADGEDSLASAAALSLGVLLEARGDVAGAEAAYRQAAAGDTSASQSATMLLSWLTRRSEHEAA